MLPIFKDDDKALRTSEQAWTLCCSRLGLNWYDDHTNMTVTDAAACLAGISNLTMQFG